MSEVHSGENTDKKGKTWEGCQRSGVFILLTGTESNKYEDVDETQMDHIYSNVPLNQLHKKEKQKPTSNAGSSPSHVNAMKQRLQERGHGIMGINALRHEQEANPEQCDEIYDDTEIPIENQTKTPKKLPKKKSNLCRAGSKPSPSPKPKTVKPTSQQKQNKPQGPAKIQKTSSNTDRKPSKHLGLKKPTPQGIFKDHPVLQKEPDVEQGNEEYADVDEDEAEKALKPLLTERNVNNNVSKRDDISAHTSAMQVNLPLPPTTKKKKGFCGLRKCGSKINILIIMFIILTLVNTGVIIFLVVNFTQSSDSTNNGMQLFSCLQLTSTFLSNFYIMSKLIFIFQCGT